MDDVIYQNLLRDTQYFAPLDTNRYRVVEIRAGGATEGQFQEKTVSESGLIPWLNESQASKPPGPSTRLLVCSPRVLDQNLWPLPLASKTLRDICDVLDVPSLFPRAICHHIPIASTFEGLKNDGVTGVFIRTNLSRTWQYAVAVVHDTKTETTTCIVLGLYANEIDQVFQSVRRSLKYMDCPALLPCILMDKALDSLIADAENRRKSLIEICFGTGHHGFHRVNWREEQDERDDLDLDVLMQKLTSLSDSCAGISAVCMMKYNFIKVISSFRKQWDHDNLSISSRHVEQGLNFFGQFLLGIESKLLYTKESAQGQVQTIYTLISQRDSRSHFILAEATQKLAALSRKDSTDMRTIASVTLIFLPPTFTATFFSTSFFNFQPSTSDHVSSWLWLYWVVTVLLTVVVLFSWWYSARLQHHKAQQEVRRQSEIKKDTTPRAKTIFELKPSARVEVLRPYLSGKVKEDVFDRKVSFLVPSAETDSFDGNAISPTTAHHPRWLPEMYGQRDHD